jgi:hypothetical protein
MRDLPAGGLVGVGATGEAPAEVAAPRRRGWRRAAALQRGRTMGRPWKDSARPGGVGALGGPAQGRVHAARGEQQHAGGDMARERARKLAERTGTRRA